MAEKETKSTVKIIAAAPPVTAAKYKAPAVTVVPAKSGTYDPPPATPPYTKARLDLR